MDDFDDFDVFEYITPVKNIFIEEDEFYDITHNELLKIKQIMDKGNYNDDYGTTFSIIINDRYIVIHDPIITDNKLTLILFYHGLGDHAWDMALNKTNWRKIASREKFIIVFVSGTNCGAIYDKRCGFNIKNYDAELKHMEDILKKINNLYSIDNVHYIGFSNGGIFSSIVAQKYGNKIFSSIINLMGGFGHKNSEVLDMQIYNPLPILFISGTNDEYLDSCIYAHEFFKINKYNATIKILPNRDHTYPIDEEENIWMYIKNINLKSKW